MMMMAMMIPLLLVLESAVASMIIDTSSWVGAEFQPSKSANEDWLWHYEWYEASISRELRIAKRALGLTAVRVFMHSAFFEADGARLIGNVDNFLGKAALLDIGVGLVFFDDCWNRSGLDLNATCAPVDGKHNGCWFASPQDVERTSVERFRPYVESVAAAFATDPRVLWWEIYNEPSTSDAFSMALREAAFGWLLVTNVSQPILSCWDENNATQLVDHHQYLLPWNGTRNAVFANATGRMRGGFITEAGARWFQGEEDRGSPLTVVHFLRALRGRAPFVPGAMIDWEVMVSNTNTRWSWHGSLGGKEPAVPFHQHVFPDGTPVSYTEAGAIRAYATGRSDFFHLDDFLDLRPNPASDEMWLALPQGGFYEAVFPATTDCLVELAFWGNRGLILSIVVDSVVVEVTPENLALRQRWRYDSDETKSCSDRYVLDAWNILRLLLVKKPGSTASVFFNPRLPDVFPDGRVPEPGPKDAPIQPMPPFLEAHKIYFPAGLNDDEMCHHSLEVIATGNDTRLDYVSVLPGVLYGEAYTPPFRTQLLLIEEEEEEEDKTSSSSSKWRRRRRRGLLFPQHYPTILVAPAFLAVLWWRLCRERSRCH